MKKTMALVVSLVMVFSTIFTCNVFGATTQNLTADVMSDILIGKSGDYQSYYAATEPGYFDLKATVNMEKVTERLKTLIAKNAEKAKTADISGSFTLTVNVDEKLDVITPSTSSVVFDIDGDKDSFLDIFAAVTESDIDVSGHVITITVKTKQGLKGTDVYDFTNSKSLLGDEINVVAQGVLSTKYADKFTVTGSATGETLVSGANEGVEYKITYNFKDVDTNDVNMSATLETRIKSNGGGGGGGSSWPSRPSTSVTPTTPVTPSGNVSVKFVTAGGKVVSSTTVAPGSTVDLSKVNAGTREGYAFAGWAVNGVVSSTAVVNEDTVIKAKWINLNAPEEFVSDEHKAYIQGYPDGNVRPEADITREEVATIIYRLLTDAKKTEIASTENNFSDVASDRWSNEAISTLANGGYISGYEDGTFKPEAAITRAEFVTIIARFINTTAVDAGFSDVDGHWAAEAINKVVDKAWIEGYTDGTFKPDAHITRAEVATIVNRMLVRYADKDGAAAAENQFADNNANEWYYLAIIEATNGHSEFGRTDNGYDEDWDADLSNDENVEADNTDEEDVDGEEAEVIDTDANDEETDADAETENVEADSDAEAETETEVDEVVVDDAEVEG